MVVHKRRYAHVLFLLKIKSSRRLQYRCMEKVGGKKVEQYFQLSFFDFKD